MKPVVENVELFIDEFVASAGGQRFAIRDLPDGVKNADYIFADARVACELKCLETNFIRNSKEKVLQILAEVRTDVPEGSVLSQVPADVRRRIRNVLEKPIRRVLEKANAQLKATRELLGAPRVKTVLFLCNNAISGIRGEYIVELVSELLVRDYSGIDGLVYFSVNCPAAGPGGLPIYQWLPSCGESSRDRLGPFLSSLGEQWTPFIRDRLTLNFIGEVNEPESVPVGLPKARNPRQAFAYNGAGAACVQTPPSLIATSNLQPGGTPVLPRIPGQCLFHPLLRTPEEGLAAHRFGWMTIMNEPDSGPDWFRRTLVSQDESTLRFDAIAAIEYSEIRSPDASGATRTWLVRTIRYLTAGYTDVTAACQWTPSTACMMVLLHPGLGEDVLKDEVQYLVSNILLLDSDSVDPTAAHEHWSAIADELLPRSPSLV